MKTSTEIAARFNLDAGALELMMMEAASLVAAGYDNDAAFVEAMTRRSDACAVMATRLNDNDPKMLAFVDELAKAVYDKFTS